MSSRPPPTSTLTLQLLGPPAITLDGQPLNARLLAKAQALLIYLAMSQQPQLRTNLMVLLWGDSSEAAARMSLRQVLANLRTPLDPFLHIERQTVALCPEASIWVDALAFEQQVTHALAQQDRASLEAALGLYRGELLSGWSVRAAPDFERWLYAEQERLRQLAIRGLEMLAYIQTEAGQLEKAIDKLRRVLILESWREEAHRTLMELLHRSGQRSAALMQYETCRKVLADELGVEPSTETTALYEQIQRDELKQEEPGPLRTYTLPLSIEEQPPATLVGRVAEWQQLQRSWQQVSQGQAQTLLIVGEAGIGKTRLAEELAGWLRRHGGKVVTARCYAAEGELAFTPIIELLRQEPVLRTLSTLDEVWLVQVARLLPELVAQRPHIHVPEPGSDPLQRQRFFEAVARAILGAGQPLLLVIDDLQWADRETLEWLHYLLRFAPHARLLVVGTLRREEVLADHPLQPLLVSLRRGQRLIEIQLERLSEKETGALAAQVAGWEVTVDERAALYQQTEGNPLFVVEMVRAQLVGTTAGPGKLYARPGPAPTPLPEGMQAVIQARLAQLSPLAQEVAQFAAAAGRAFSLELLSHAGSYPEEELLQSLDELWQRHILQEQAGSSYDFSHARIRDVAYNQISPLRRRLLHRRLAQALERLHVHELDTISGLLALHYELGAQPPQAIDAYQRAARFANQTFAHEEAAEALRKAVSLLPALTDVEARHQRELELQLDLGHTLMMANGWADEKPQQAYERARVLCQAAGADPDLYAAMWGLHEIYMFQAKGPQALEASEVCWKLAQQSGDPELLLQAHHAYWGVYFWFYVGPNGLQSAVDHARQGIALYRPEWHRSHVQRYGNHDPGTCALFMRAKAQWLLGYPDQAHAAARAAVALATRLQHPFTLTQTLLQAAKIYSCRGEVDLVLKIAEQVKPMVDRQGVPFHVAQELLLRGWALGQIERSREATELGRQAIAIWQEGGARLELPYLSALVAETQITAGQHAAALTTLQTGLETARMTSEEYWLPELYRLQGQCRLAVGEHGAAEASLQQALTLAQAQQTKSLELRAAMDLSQLWVKQGRRTEAYDLLHAIHSWFSEGFDTADLRRAEVLLRALAS